MGFKLVLMQKTGYVITDLTLCVRVESHEYFFSSANCNTSSCIPNQASNPAVSSSLFPTGHSGAAVSYWPIMMGEMTHTISSFHVSQTEHLEMADRFRSAPHWPSCLSKREMDICLEYLLLAGV